MMEKETSSPESGVADGAAPDWKEVVREMFEEGEGVSALFRWVGGRGGERERQDCLEFKDVMSCDVM